MGVGDWVWGVEGYQSTKAPKHQRELGFEVWGLGLGFGGWGLGVGGWGLGVGGWFGVGDFGVRGWGLGVEGNPGLRVEGLGWGVRG